MVRMLTVQSCVSRQLFLDELEVSPATFKRDLDYLRDRMGIPIIWDRELRGYRIERDSPDGDTELPGLWFSADEIYALITADYFLERLQPGLLSPLIQPLRERLQSLAIDGDQTWTEVTNRIRVLPMFARTVKSECFGTIATGVLERRRLQIHHYGRQTGEYLDREVSPQRLVHYRDNWYLDTWCHLRKGMRTFSVDAIRDATVLDTKARDVSTRKLDAELGAGYGIFSGRKVQWAKLRFTPERARWVSRETWHGEQRTRNSNDGSYLMEVPYSDPRELVMDILKHGDQVEVLGPKTLRNQVAEAHRRAAEQYR
jgi:predicted DNA-binding transcriptional regulator YafY